MESANSYEEAMRKVLELYPQMDMDALTELAERSALAAQIFGRKRLMNYQLTIINDELSIVHCSLFIVKEESEKSPPGRGQGWV